MNSKLTQAIGIDLGTTYSCIAYLNEHGQPVTIPNQEGELATPSVVFFDGDYPIVGTEALRNSIAHPDRVVQFAKRYMGDPHKFWNIDGRQYSPTHISGMIIRKLIAAAQEQLGEIREAVITVPAQFSDAQRHATILAGHAAGLEKIEMINEPVAAALCHVLGNLGPAFTALAVDQRLLVYDLGGGTLDLAVVHYTSDQVRVVAADGDLQLGGLDWTQALVDLAAEHFIADFGVDPRDDRESLQFLALEAEQAKRSLSVRPRAAVTVRHARHHRTYQIEQAEFERRCQPLIARSEVVTRRILSQNRMGWAHIDVVLTTGGASRMPMIRDSLKRLSGTTLNTSLSPDQSIAHGAACYAGMLLTDDNPEHKRTVFSSETSTRLKRLQQQSVSARHLGILVRNPQTSQREPHYLIPANSPLPAAHTHLFGTVVANQTRVHVQIVESGSAPEQPAVLLGACHITQLPPGLPEGSAVEVTISYDRQARVHVSARELQSGKLAEVEFIRQENLAAQLEHQTPPAFPSPTADVASKPASTASADSAVIPPSSAPTSSAPPRKPATATNPAPAGTAPGQYAAPGSSTDPDLVSAPDNEDWFRDVDLTEAPQPLLESEQPVLLCNDCSTPLLRGVCPQCGSGAARQPAASSTRPRPGQTTPGRRPKRAASNSPPAAQPAAGKAARPAASARQQPRTKTPAAPGQKPPATSAVPPAAPTAPQPAQTARKRRRKPLDPAEAEFWDLVDGD